MTPTNLKNIEEFAWDQSGLSADGCLEKLDNYARKGIELYGRILLKKQKEMFREGYEGCCYCCETVGILNQELEEKLKSNKMDEHNSDTEELDKWKNAARRLYGVVLHLQAISDDKSVIVVGNGLRLEAVEALNEYEKLNNYEQI